MLQHLERIPRIQENDRSEHRRQVFGFRQDDPPFIEPFILIPIEIVDQRILLSLATPAGRLSIGSQC